MAEPTSWIKTRQTRYGAYAFVYTLGATNFIAAK